MATYSDFTSLLQLGVGVGIGLPVFRAPITVRVGLLNRKLEIESKVWRGIDTELAKWKRREMGAIKVRLARKNEDLYRIMRPFMGMSIAGAMIDLFYLCLAAVESTETLSGPSVVMLFLVTVGWYSFIVVALELIAAVEMGPLLRRLREVTECQLTPPV